MPDRVIAYDGTSYTVGVAHKAADALPWKLDTDEFRDIIKSMKVDGFDEDKPIYRQKGTGFIIAGRRRELAAAIAGVKPLYKDRDWNDLDIIQFVERDELNRRHLSASEKATSVLNLYELKKHGGSRKSPEIQGENQVANLPLDSEKTREEAAKDAGVSTRTIRSAAIVKKNSPRLFAAVSEGKLTVDVAEKLVKKATAKEIEKILASDDVSKAAKALLKTKTPKKKAPAPPPPQKPSEPVNQDNAVTGDQTTPVHVPQEPPAPEEPVEDESTVMGKLNALLKQVKQLVKKNPLLARDAAVAIHEVGAEVIEFTPPLKFGEQRAIYDSPYFRNKAGVYEGPTVQHLEGIGSKAIDTYGKPVPQHLRDEFCDDGYSRIGRHLELAVAELQQADDLYQKMSARPMGVHWCKTQTWNAGFTNAAQMLDDVTSKWWSESVPFTVCRFCMGAMKNAEGVRCMKCNFSGYWPRSEARSHPTMVKDMRPKVAPAQEAKA